MGSCGLVLGTEAASGVYALAASIRGEGFDMSDQELEELESFEDEDLDEDAVPAPEDLDDEDWDEGADVSTAIDEEELEDEEDADESSAPATETDDEEALDELEAEELEMLTDDELSETIAVDEAAERAIRRAALSMEGEGADERSEDEFVCQSCFLVLNVSQLADGRKRICKDCAA